MDHDGSADENGIFGAELAKIEPTGGISGEKQKLLMQTLNEAQVDFLLQRTPRHEIKLRQGRGGQQFSYVEHGYVTERLNLVFGFNWDFEITDKEILDDEAVVEARLTVRTPGGQTIVKTQFGGAEVKRHASGPKMGKPLSIADDYKAAASDALKKCASLLGIGLDLYGRDRPYETDNEAPPRASVARKRRVEVVDVEPSQPGGPTSERVDIVSGLNGLCTQAQWRDISRLAIEAGMDVPELCASLGVTTLSQLTEARAARVIARLRELAYAARRSQAS